MNYETRIRPDSYQPVDKELLEKLVKAVPEKESLRPLTEFPVIEILKGPVRKFPEDYCRTE